MSTERILIGEEFGDENGLPERIELVGGDRVVTYEVVGDE